jgi:hypothetical protein
MLVVIIAKKTLHSCFSNVHTSAAGAGIMGVLVRPFFLHFSIV